MEHDAVVAHGPTRPAGHLLADKPIHDAQSVIREFLFRVKDVAELFVELLVLVIGYFQYAVFDAKGVLVIIAYFVARNLDRPVSQVLAVEQRDPLSFLLGRRISGAR